MGLTSMHVEAKIVIVVVIQTHPQSQLQFFHSQNYSCSWKVDLTSMLVPYWCNPRSADKHFMDSSGGLVKQ
jgi:hypothetical protein